MKILIILTYIILITGCVHRDLSITQERIMSDLGNMIDNIERDLDELDEISDEYIEEVTLKEVIVEIDILLNQIDDIFTLDEANESELIP